jgi:hypothetical protein
MILRVRECLMRSFLKYRSSGVREIMAVRVMHSDSADTPVSDVHCAVGLSSTVHAKTVKVVKSASDVEKTLCTNKFFIDELAENFS